MSDNETRPDEPANEGIQTVNEKDLAIVADTTFQLGSISERATITAALSLLIAALWIVPAKTIRK